MLIYDCIALKSEALAWRMTGDQSDADSTYDRIDMLWKYHGRPQGIFSTDEHLAGLNPSRGWVYAHILHAPITQSWTWNRSEYCASVETAFSLETIYAILGNPEWADLTERIAYNSIPAQVRILPPAQPMTIDCGFARRVRQTGGHTNTSNKQTRSG